MVLQARLDQGRCLNCGKGLDAVTSLEDSMPKQGSIMVCTYCGHLMEWTGERLAELSDEAIEEMAGDKDLLAMVELRDRFRRSLKGTT
jgi:DNA-directed RNA polymerase subunit RPC12/RpoP